MTSVHKCDVKHHSFNESFILTVVERTNELAFRSCMGYGPAYYRTFDGLEYLFTGSCSYTLYSDGLRTITETKVDCNAYSTCRKVRAYVIWLIDRWLEA